MEPAFSRACKNYRENPTKSSLKGKITALQILVLTKKEETNNQLD